MQKQMIIIDRKLSSLLLSGICSKREGVSFLGEHIELNKQRVKIIGQGDDGLLLNVGDGQYAIKSFINNYANNKDGSVDIRNQIARDKAERELNALKILTEHPNFPTILSNEVDSCEIKDDVTSNSFTGLAIRMEYIDGLKDINYPIIAKSIEKGVLNYSKYEETVKTIFNQMFDVLIALHNTGIRHRDLDIGNVKIRSSDMRLVVMDFSRANVPDMQDLNEKINWAVNNIMPPPGYPKADESAFIRSRIRDGNFVRDAYSMPCILDGFCTKEPSDYEMMRRIVTGYTRPPQNITEKFIEKADIYIDWIWPWMYSPADYSTFLTASKQKLLDTSIEKYWTDGDAQYENIINLVKIIQTNVRNKYIYMGDEAYARYENLCRQWEQSETVDVNDARLYCCEVSNRVKNSQHYVNQEASKAQIVLDCNEVYRIASRLSS